MIKHMLEERKANPEMESKVERRRFTAEYKRQIVVEVKEYQYGELGSLLRREGLTYAQIGQRRSAYAEGTLGKKRDPVANPNRAEMRRLEAENDQLMRELERAKRECFSFVASDQTEYL